MRQQRIGTIESVFPSLSLGIVCLFLAVFPSAVAHAADLRLSCRENTGTVISWPNEGDGGIARFQVERLQGGRWEPVCSLLPGTGWVDPIPRYTVVDRNVVPGEMYTYRVVRVQVDGRRLPGPEGRVICSVAPAPETLSAPAEKQPVGHATRQGERASGTPVRPVFAQTPYAVVTPTQVGRVRRAEVDGPGFYRVPEEIAGVYNLGRELPVLSSGAERLVFVRGISDFYTGKNVVFGGELTISGPPGVPPAPAPQAVLEADGSVTGIFRAEEDLGYDANTFQARAPNWYWREWPGADLSVGLNVLAPAGTGSALLRVALNAWSVSGEENALEAWVNGEKVMDNTRWNWSGYAILTVPFDASILVDGENTILLRKDAGVAHASAKFLDYVEIEAPAEARLRGGGLILATAADAGGRSVQVPGAVLAADITSVGGEQTIGLALGQTEALDGGRLLYFSDRIDDLTWSPRMDLAEPADLNSADYVAVAAHADYVSVLEPLLSKHRSAGVQTAVVAFETLRDVYGGGLFGPQGILTMLDRHAPDFLLLAGTTNHDYRQRRESTADWLYPWIPSGWHQVREWTPTDDLYTRGYRSHVGRVPIHDRAELAAWVAKTVDYEPGDVLALLAGTNDPALNFQQAQRSNLDFLPATLVTPDNQTKLITAVNTLGARTVLYQGHGSWSYLNQLDAKLLDSGDAQSYAPSAWAMGTCNAGLYHRPADALVGQGRGLCLAYMLLREPGAGAVAVLACPTVADAGELKALTAAMITEIKYRPGVTWGELLRQLKRNRPHSTTVQLYTLFGDPLTPVIRSSPRRLTVFSPPSGGYLPVAAGRERTPVSLAFDGVWLPEEPVSLQYRLNEAPWQQAQLAEEVLTRSGAVVQAYWDTSQLTLSDRASVRLRLETNRQDLTIRWSTTGPLGFDFVPPAVTLTSWTYSRGTAALTATATDERSGLSGSFRFLLEHPENGAVIADSGWIEGNSRSFPEVNGALPWRVLCRARDGAGNMGSTDAVIVFDTNGDADRDGRTNQEEFDGGTDPLGIDIVLQPGWNPVSLPHPVASEIWDAIRAAAEGTIWEWTGGRYRPSAGQPAPLHGVWIFASREAAVNCGMPSATPAAAVLDRNWTFVGPPELARVPSVDPVLSVWSFDNGRLRRVVPPVEEGTAFLLPGKAYWLFSTSGGGLDFEAAIQANE